MCDLTLVAYLLFCSTRDWIDLIEYRELARLHRVCVCVCDGERGGHPIPTEAFFAQCSKPFLCYLLVCCVCVLNIKWKQQRMSIILHVWIVMYAAHTHTHTSRSRRQSCARTNTHNTRTHVLIFIQIGIQSSIHGLGNVYSTITCCWPLLIPQSSIQWYMNMKHEIGNCRAIECVWHTKYKPCKLSVWCGI